MFGTRSSMFQVLPIFTVIGVLFAAPAIAGGAVLYDQTANPIPDGLNSQEYPDNSTFTNQLADDFTVPAGQTWTITEIDVVGEGNAVLPVNVHFYTDLNALPGMRLFFHPQIAAGNGPDYTIPLSGVPPLGPGTYWAS